MSDLIFTVIRKKTPGYKLVSSTRAGNLRS